MFYLLLIIGSIILISLSTIYFSMYINNEKYKNKVKNLINNTSSINDQKFIKIPKYYINLDRSKDRREKFESQVKKYHLENTFRIEAVNAKNLDDYDYIYEYDIYNERNKIELAVTMSHIKAILEAHDNKDEYALIMEDDINLVTVPLWKIKLEEIIQNLDKDCDVLLLANNCFQEGKIEIKKANSAKNIACGVCYLITKKGMEKVKNNFYKDGKISFLKEKQLSQDSIVFDIHFLNYFNLYYTSQSLFITEDFQQKSDVREEFFGFINSSISEKVIDYYSNLT